MHRFKKLLIISALVLIGIAQFPSASALNLLPGNELTDLYSETACMEMIQEYEYSAEGQSIEDYLKNSALNEYSSELFLGCAIKSGYIRFWMLPYFISYALNFIISLAGLIVVTMIIIGAYYYIAGGLTEDKEKGKTIIKYALVGFVLILSSWTLVNILLLALTS